MKSLSSSVNNLLLNWKELKDCLTKITASNEGQKVSFSIEGLQGAMFSYFVNNFCNSIYYKNMQAVQYGNSSKSSPEYNTISNNLLIVVPTEYEANNIAQDLKTVFPEAEIIIFPSWGSVPYRRAQIFIYFSFNF